MFMSAKKEIYTLDEAFLYALSICNEDEDATKAVDTIRDCEVNSDSDIEAFKIAFVAEHTKGFLRAVNDFERDLFKLVDERYFYANARS